MGKELNYYYTQTEEGMELDFRQMPFRNKIKFVYLLLTKQKVHIIGKNEITTNGGHLLGA